MLLVNSKEKKILIKPENGKVQLKDYINPFQIKSVYREKCI